MIMARIAGKKTFESTLMMIMFMHQKIFRSLLIMILFHDLVNRSITHDHSFYACRACHSDVIRNGILNHVIVLIRSITVPDDVRRAAVNVVYAMTFTPEGRAQLMDLDAVVVLVPVIRVSLCCEENVQNDMQAVRVWWLSWQRHGIDA